MTKKRPSGSKRISKSSLASRIKAARKRGGAKKKDVIRRMIKDKGTIEVKRGGKVK